MAERHRSSDGTRETDAYVSDEAAPSKAGRDGGDMARRIGTKDEEKRQVKGDTSATRVTKKYEKGEGNLGGTTAQMSMPRTRGAADMAEISNGTHIVIANSEKVLYLVNQTDAEDPYFTVMDKETQDNPSDLDQSANRPGRMSDSQGNKSAFQDTDWHELAKERFADEIAEHLYDLAHHGKIDRLVLVAGPKVLGNIRDALHQVVKDKIVAEVPKNLAGHPLNEIEAILTDELKAA